MCLLVILLEVGKQAGPHVEPPCERRSSRFCSFPEDSRLMLSTSTVVFVKVSMDGYATEFVSVVERKRVEALSGTNGWKQSIN